MKRTKLKWSLIIILWIRIGYGGMKRNGIAAVIHRRSVSLEAATCGVFSVTKTVVALPLMAIVCWRYSFKTVIIYSLLSGAYARKSMTDLWIPGFVVFTGSPMVNTAREKLRERFLTSRRCSLCPLWPDSNDMIVTIFWDSNFRDNLETGLSVLR